MSSYNGVLFIRISRYRQQDMSTGVTTWEPGGDLVSLKLFAELRWEGCGAEHILSLADLQVGRDPGLTKGGGEDAGR